MAQPTTLDALRRSENPRRNFIALRLLFGVLFAVSLPFYWTASEPMIDIAGRTIEPSPTASYVALATSCVLLAICGLFHWLVTKREARLLGGIDSMIYDDFARALKDNQVVGEIYIDQSKHAGTYYSSLKYCYVLTDDRVVAVRGSLSPRRDNELFRYFRNVEYVYLA